MPDPTQRFSDRVADYIKYRPGYPDEAIEYIIRQTGLPAGAVIADIGSGTGIFSALLLAKGYNVYGVEPNEPMRSAAESLLSDFDNFHSANGDAEHTGLPDHSVDLITAATAFHWFNRDAAKAEFKRLLKPGGHVALLWNVRKPNADAFAKAYEALLRQLPDYLNVSEKYGSYEDLALFFADGSLTQAAFDNRQLFDYEGLAGRARSSSFVPQPDTTEGIHFYAELERLFNQYQQNGQVAFHYDTMIYIGRL